MKVQAQPSRSYLNSFTQQITSITWRHQPLTPFTGNEKKCISRLTHYITCHSLPHVCTLIHSLTHSLGNAYQHQSQQEHHQRGGDTRNVKTADKFNWGYVGIAISYAANRGQVCLSPYIYIYISGACICVKEPYIHNTYIYICKVGRNRWAVNIPLTHSSAHFYTSFTYPLTHWHNHTHTVTFNYSLTHLRTYSLTHLPHGLLVFSLFPL